MDLSLHDFIIYAIVFAGVSLWVYVFNKLLDWIVEALGVENG